MQCGGIEGKATDMATLMVRTFFHYAKDNSLSAAALFVDVRNAFYTVVRETLFDDYNTDKDIDKLFEKLQLPKDTMMALYGTLSGEAVLGDLPPHLRRLLRDAHSATWYVMEGSETVTQTNTGTRPGNPLADIVFNLLFAEILQRLKEEMHKHGLRTVIPARRTNGLFMVDELTNDYVDVADVSYVDDLTVLVAREDRKTSSRR